MLEETFSDCETAAVAVQTAALATVAVGLAALAFTSAYIIRIVRRWRAWTRDDNN